MTAATTIETERLVLVPLRVEHAVEMVTVLADPSLYEYTGGEPPTVGDLERRYRLQVAGSGSPDEVWCNWVLTTIDDGRAVGYVQATVADDSADMAWVVGVPHQGQGFAAEAASALCRWLQGADVRRCDAHIHPDHVASHAVASRIGMRRSGEVDDDGEEIWTADLDG